MNQATSKLQLRADRKTAKRDEKKRNIAESAIEALKKLGYANTSLRDIAAESGQSLGMLHYYFEDRSDLILYCVDIYKAQFVEDISKALNEADGRDEVISAFAAVLADSIMDDGMVHLIWYDIRSQAMFDPAFRPVVTELEARFVDLVRTAYERSGQPSADHIETQYAMLDGFFRYHMQKQLEENPISRAELREDFRRIFELML